jgi:hypothetical protein
MEILNKVKDQVSSIELKTQWFSPGQLYKEDPPMYNTDDTRIIQLGAIEENLGNFTQDILDLLNGVRGNV